MAEDLRDFLEKQGIAIDAIKRVIINYKKLSKANVTLTKTKSRLADLKYWEKLQCLHARIRRAATAEDRKKLPYFLQDEFLAAKDAYNKAADYLQEAIANFVMPESSIYDLNADSVANFVMPDSSDATLVLILHFAILRVRLLSLPIIREMKVVHSLIGYRFRNVSIVPIRMVWKIVRSSCYRQLSSAVLLLE